MIYMGSKAKLAKKILPHILPERGNRTWVEPFVGGGNMIDKVDGRRIGSDIDKYIIALLTAVRDGWLPPGNVSEIDYNAVRSNPSAYPDHYVAFIGYQCSFGAKWWGGFARNKKGTNYALSSCNVISRQQPLLKGVEFVHADYRELLIPEQSLIYCDPPYRSTTKYKMAFDHDAFFEWCRHKRSEGHLVFISEYSAPPDFLCVHEIECKTRLNKNKAQARVEKLFTLK